MANPVTIFEIAGKKEDSICDFYSSLFEWDINQDDDCGNYIIVDFENTFTLFQMGEGTSPLRFAFCESMAV